MTLPSWAPIRFDRWRSFAVVCQDVDIYAAAHLADAIARMQVSWDRLGDNLARLFIPSGPEGTHAYHHFHGPSDPEVRDQAVAACILDYETALLFLDVALTMSARCAATATGASHGEWTKLVKAAERGDEGLPTKARRQILYLQRTVLYARNKSIAHPLDLISSMSFDNVGNVTFWRSPLSPDEARVADADHLLRRVRSDIRADARVGQEIPAPLALTWIAARSDSLSEDDRKLLDQLREALGYCLPLPPEFAPAFDEMIAHFVTTLPVSPFSTIALASVKHPTAASADMEIAASVQPADPDHVVRLLAEARAAQDGGSHERARLLFAEAISLDPENGPAHAHLGQALLKLGEPRRALDHLYAALAIEIPMSQLRESLAQAHFNSGACAFSAGDYGAAAAHYRRVCELESDDVEARRHLAIALTREGRLEQALLEAARLDRDHDGDAEAMHDVGLVLLEAGHPEWALTKFERAATLRPDWPWPLLQQATALLRLGSSSEAEGKLRGALALDPDFAPALDALASELHRSGRSGEAQALASHTRQTGGPSD